MTPPTPTITSWAAPVDLDNCATEPIHVPGAIQPHGMLLAVTEPDLVVAVVSANVGDWFGCPGRRDRRALDDLLGEDQRQRRPQARTVRWVQRYDELPLSSTAGRYRHALPLGGHLLVEIEPTRPPTRQASIVREAAMALQVARPCSRWPTQPPAGSAS